YALSGRAAEGLPFLERALGAFETMGHRLAQSLLRLLLGEAYVHADRLEDALEVGGRALILARAGGQRGYEARALPLLRGLAARRDPAEHAEGHSRDALALAEELGMRPLHRPLPPRPGQALPPRRQASGSAGALQDRDGDVSRDGDDALAGEGRDRASRNVA